MVRFILLSILLTLLLRAVLRIWRNMLAGMRDPGASGASRAPQRGVQMVRDPVCGTYVVPARAVPLVARGERLYFCSTDCRDKYHARPHARAAAAHDRFA